MREPLKTDNPYESPLITSTDAATESVQQVVVAELSDVAKRRISRTSKIAKLAAAFSAVASLGAVMQIWVTFRWLGPTNGWTAWHFLIALRIMYTPCWVLLAWRLWHYGKVLDQWRATGIRHTEKTIERQDKLWLAIALLIFVQLVGLAAGFAGSMMDIMPQ